MIRQWRYAQTSEQIKPELINSPILRGLLGNYDAYDAGDGEIVFFDVYQNFFFQVIDSSYSSAWGVSSELFTDADGEIDENYFNYLGSVEMPILRVLYITKHRRRAGRFGRIMKDLTSLSDETGQSIGLFCDSFKISGHGRELTAYEAYEKFKDYGYEKTDDWIKDVYELRKKYMSYGFQNLFYDKAQVTEGYQHFVYISENAPAEERKLLEAMKVNYCFKRFDLPADTD